MPKNKKFKISQDGIGGSFDIRISDPKPSRPLTTRTSARKLVFNTNEDAPSRNFQKFGYIETQPSKIASNVSVVPMSDSKKITMQVNQYVPHFLRFPPKLDPREFKNE